MYVLILSSNNGGGHNMAAQAISDCFAAHGHRCEVRDCLSFLSERVSRTVARSHTLVYQRAPKVFGRSYARTEQRSHMFRKHHRARRLIDSGRFKLRRHIRQEGFDAVICTHVFAAMMLTAAREGERCPSGRPWWRPTTPTPPEQQPPIWTCISCPIRRLWPVS